MNKSDQPHDEGKSHWPKEGRPGNSPSSGDREQRGEKRRGSPSGLRSAYRRPERRRVTSAGWRLAQLIAGQVIAYVLRRWLG
jgi:hypothetical protein